jgi:chemotaxis protein histidine kinase CheA
MVNKKNVQQLPLLWAAAHQVRTCPSLVEKSKDASRIGHACGRACMKDEETCLCHLPKEKREVYSNKAKQTRLENTERKQQEKQAQHESDETKQVKELKAPKVPKEKKVKEPKAPKEAKVKEPKEPKAPKEKKVKEPKETKVKEEQVEEVVEHVEEVVEHVESLAAVLGPSCIAVLKSGDLCMNHTVRGKELCKKHSK